MAECLFEPLVRLRLPDLTIEPAAARRWVVAPLGEGERYTFFLRREGRWSNGDPVTAGDFVYAWRRAMLPDFASQYVNLMWVITGARPFYDWRQQVLRDYGQQGEGRSPEAAERLWAQAVERFQQTVGLRAVDERTLQVDLVRPTHYFLELCAFATFMPVHRKTVDQRVAGPDPLSGQLKQEPWLAPGQLVSNGPYVLADRKIKTYLLLKQNEHFWNRPVMGNRSILERIIENEQTALLAYDRHEVHWLPDIPTTKPLAADLAGSARCDVHLFPGAGTYYYLFNCAPNRPDGSANPLADGRVRRALSMAIDRKKIVTSVTRLNQPVATTFTPPGSVPGYVPPAEAGVRFDPEQARKLLAEAGHVGGEGLDRLSILYNTAGGHEQIAQFVQQAWRDQLGVQVSLEGVEKKVFSDRRQNHQFTIARGGWFGDYRDATTFLDLYLTASGQNDGGYSNPAFDRLLDAAAVERDPGRRLELLREAEALMLAEQPIAPLFQYVQMELFDPDRVTGLFPNPWHRRRLELVRVVGQQAR